jgi:glutathione S-transferase
VGIAGPRRAPPAATEAWYKALDDTDEEAEMIQIYGSPQNRGFRSYWMLEELGLEYEGIPKDTQAGETRTPEFLAINPNGHVPTLVDGDTTVWESMAINLYLAERYGGPLAPSSLDQKAACLKWSFWVMTEVEGQLLTYAMNTRFLPEGERDAAAASEALEKLTTALGVLDGELAKRPFLAGDAFTVADLNVASVLSWTRLGDIDISDHANAARWLESCLSRPCAAKFLQG